MLKKFSIIALVMLALVLHIESAFAVPTNCIGGMADFFYGTLKINGANASNHTQMRAKILGDIRGSYNTSAVGRYGDALTDDKFAVSGVAEGYEVPQNITFEVFANAQWVQAVLNGSLHSFPYTCGKEYNLNMSVTAAVDNDNDDDGFNSDVDCNDNNATIFPGAEEECDNVDNDCNPLTSDGIDEPGYGEPTNCGTGECASVGVVTCISGEMTDTCEPDDPLPETCDGLDNDCDTFIDEGVKTTFFQDFDIDTYGNAAVTQQACNATAGYVANDDDCNDNNGSIHPGAPEVCDGVDNDCDALIDEGDVCVGCPDNDVDGVCNEDDNCINVNNEDQLDSDGDGFGNACDICAGFNDNVDTDDDNTPDGCDSCPLDPLDDADEDGVCGNVDACPGFDDSDDLDFDDIPDGCDLDDDGDGINDTNDNCPEFVNPSQSDLDDDELGDVCDTDDDGDGIDDEDDNCPSVNNLNQSDLDGDETGDACDNDDDNDTIPDNVDNCPNIFNPNQRDLDENGVGSACDPDENITTYNVSITIYDGWTLFGLPFKPLDIDNSEELGQAVSNASADCDVVMKFNGNTQLWQDDLLGLPDPSFALSGTEGYFIHCDNQVEFKYEGTLWV